MGRGAVHGWWASWQGVRAATECGEGGLVAHGRAGLARGRMWHCQMAVHADIPQDIYIYIYTQSALSILSVLFY